MKQFLLAISFAVVAAFAGTTASATITDTFYGHIITADNNGYTNPTTDDFNNNFGGGNLIGQAFTLTMTLDVYPGATYVVGGTYYGSYYGNPITAALTINGKTFSINDSSDGDVTDLGDGTTETHLQTFVWSGAHQGVQVQGIVLDLTTLVPSTADLNVPLPPMLLSHGDFVTTYAEFYDQSTLFYNGQVETLNLGIESVNEAPVPVPEPSTYIAGALLLLPFGANTLRILRKKIAA